MKRVLILIMKIVGGLLAAIIVLLAIAFGAFHTDAVQNRLVENATQMLSDYLHTTVRIEKANVSFIDQGVRLYGVEIDDQQLLPLLHHEVSVSKAMIRGLEAHLYKPATDSDSVANYQFVIDAFKSKKKVQADTSVVDTALTKKKPLLIDVKKVTLEDINISYNDTLRAHLGSLDYKKDRQEQHFAKVNDLTTSFIKKTKKGPVDTRLSVES